MGKVMEGFSGLFETDGKQEFDAIVVASGHYHACKVPQIPGLDAWKEAWPSRVQHSKSYRTAGSYRDQVGVSLRFKYIS